MVCDLKVQSEGNTKLKIYVGNILLDVKTVIEDVIAFNKYYTKKISMTY